MAGELGVDDSLGEALDRLHGRLLERGRREALTATRIEVLHLAGYNPSEIERRLVISHGQYLCGRRWLREDLLDS